MQRAGRLILKEFGPQSVVINGGHLEGGAKDFSLPRMINLSGKAHEFKPVTPMVLDVHFAAVITAELAKGKTLLPGS